MRVINCNKNKKKYIYYNPTARHLNAIPVLRYSIILRSSLCPICHPAKQCFPLLVRSFRPKPTLHLKKKKSTVKIMQYILKYYVVLRKCFFIYFLLSLIKFKIVSKSLSNLILWRINFINRWRLGPSPYLGNFHIDIVLFLLLFFYLKKTLFGPTVHQRRRRDGSYCFITNIERVYDCRWMLVVKVCAVTMHLVSTIYH